MSVIPFTFYNQTIRNMTVLFGSLFTTIQLVRYDQSRTTELERQTVPIILGQKEKWYSRTTQDPNLTRSVKVVTPRMSYQFKGITYDATRKQNSLLRNVSNDKTNSQFKEVPINFHYTLSIYVRNIEDGAQLIEQIVPAFKPSYTIPAVSMISSLNLVRDVEVWLENIDYTNNSEGEPDEDREIIWTLDFGMKGWLFQPVTTSALILQANTYFYDYSTRKTTITALVLGSGTGTYAEGERVFQGSSVQFQDAAATVVDYDSLNSKLYVKDTLGTFTQNTVLRGVTSGATYNLSSYYVSSSALSQIYVHPNPISNTAGNSNITITITEAPNIKSST